MLTDVYLTQLNVLGWIVDHFNSNITMLPESDLLPSTVSVDQLATQGYVDMYQSKQFATNAALTALGWTVPERHTGVLVYAYASKSPAAVAGLRVADRIEAINGVATLNQCALLAQTMKLLPGAHVHLLVQRAHVSSSGTITYAAPSTVALTMAAPTSVINVNNWCANLHGDVRAVMGVELEDDVAFSFPGGISVATPDIGGPSAGLAMTLALMARLSSTPIAGHHVVAATGTIDVDGNVGDVGGVQQKTIAVERAGATVFLVPSVEVATARAASDGHLRVIGVSTLAQALAALRHLGGARPSPLTKPYFLPVAP
jgi:PDZ domain-containing protein